MFYLPKDKQNPRTRQSVTASLHRPKLWMAPALAPVNVYQNRVGRSSIPRLAALSCDWDADYHRDGIKAAVGARTSTIGSGECNPLLLFQMHTWGLGPPTNTWIQISTPLSFDLLALDAAVAWPLQGSESLFQGQHGVRAHNSRESRLA